MNNQLLPIGSIIKIDSQYLMICGYFQNNIKINNERYDYACCIYPNGIGKKVFTVKKENIQDIIFIGFQDGSFTEFKKTRGGTSNE